MTTSVPQRALLTEWATGIARQTWPECSVQITHHHDGKATFVITPEAIDAAAFSVDMEISVPELTALLQDAALLGATQHLQGAATAFKSETDIAHQAGFDEGYQSGVDQGEKRGRSAQNKHALDIITEIEQRLEEARDEQVALHKVRSIIDTNATDLTKVDAIRALLAPRAGKSIDPKERLLDTSYSYR